MQTKKKKVNSNRISLKVAQSERKIESFDVYTQLNPTAPDRRWRSKVQLEFDWNQVSSSNVVLWVKWVFNAPTGMIQQLYHWRRDFIAEYIVFVIKQKEKNTTLCDN